MSTYQMIAAMRWFFLLRRYERVTFEMAREMIPKYCDLAPEELRHTRGTKHSRINEANWLIDMRNIKRDVAEKREKLFVEDGEALKLSAYGKERSALISDKQLDLIIRRRQKAA